MLTMQQFRLSVFAVGLLVVVLVVSVGMTLLWNANSDVPDVFCFLYMFITEEC